MKRTIEDIKAMLDARFNASENVSDEDLEFVQDIMDTLTDTSSDDIINTLTAERNDAINKYNSLKKDYLNAFLRGEKPKEYTEDEDEVNEPEDKNNPSDWNLI